MNILDAIVNEMGGNKLNELSTQLGIGPEETQKVFATALPALLGGLTKNAQDPQGAQSLASALDRDHSSPLNDILGSVLGGGNAQNGLGSLIGAFAGGNQGGNSLGSLIGAATSMLGGQKQQTKALDGAGILGHIFGGQQEQVSNQISNASGVNATTIMKFLPILAPIVMSALGSIKQKNNLDAGGLSTYLNEQSQEIGGNDFITNTIGGLLGGGGDNSSALLNIGGKLLQSGLLGKLF